jgi:biopolymer transport protein TolR
MRTLARKAFRARPNMNVTPLVDVVLVLLIIFMVIIPAMEKSAQVELPSVFNVDPDAKGKMDPFTLSLTATGETYFEQEQLDRPRLVTALREANRREPQRRLILRADRVAHYREVRKLFKECQELGFPGVSLKVNERRSDPSKP